MIAFGMNFSRFYSFMVRRSKFVFVVVGVAAFALLDGCQQSQQQPQQPLSLKFQVVPTLNGDAWKIDTQSGELWFCSDLDGRILSTKTCLPVKTKDE